jgi:diaminopimelate epimerase
LRGLRERLWRSYRKLGGEATVVSLRAANSQLVKSDSGRARLCGNGAKAVVRWAQTSVRGKTSPVVGDRRRSGMSG